ncbi:MAG: DNA polymerase IV [Candidatus Moraniibacteriota bacterium]
MSAPIALGRFPRAILHIDGDAFFASCEQARNPELRGKPVICGAERGIAASMSYEAKAMGITRAMRLFEIKKCCPNAVILPSDYETYSLLSRRFYEIVRRYTSDVEEYGIDECFADITGFQRPHKLSYTKIAAVIQENLKRELGFTFSVGLASTKVLAKLGSKWAKPYGLTAIPNKHIHRYLETTPVGAVWGIGPQTTALLKKFGVETALDFVRQDETWVKQYFSKPFQEIWAELRGQSVMPLATEPRSNHSSVQKMKTFTPPSNDPRLVFAQLAKNIESACMRARQYGLEAKRVYVLLRTQSFEHHSTELTLSRPTNFAHELMEVARPAFADLFHPGTFYRATMVTLAELTIPNSQPDLFGGSLVVDNYRRLYQGIDQVRAKYGKHTLHFGSSFMAHDHTQHEGNRKAAPERQKHLLKGETKRRRLGIPMFTAELS